MSEILSRRSEAEILVFGDAFSFQYGQADEDTVNSFFKQRVNEIANGATAWLPRELDVDTGVVVDLYKNRKLVTTIDFEYELQVADVYVASTGSQAPDKMLYSQLTFDEAVAKATEYAEDFYLGRAR